VNVRRAALAAVALAVGGVLLVGNGVRAADGSGVPPGAVICTDHGQSNSGVWAYGHATYRVPVTWTIRAATSPDGPEVELVRWVQWELKTVTVAAPEPGTRYYRVCLANTTDGAVHYQMQFGPNGQAAFARSGTHMAMLGAGGHACGDMISGWLATAGRLTGTADVPVRFGVRVSNGDGDVLREDPLETTTKIDRLLTPHATESYEVCVTNISRGIATVSWDLQRL
jgi:hypothetical protein